SEGGTTRPRKLSATRRDSAKRRKAVVAAKPPYQEVRRLLAPRPCGVWLESRTEVWPKGGLPSYTGKLPFPRPLSLFDSETDQPKQKSHRREVRFLLRCPGSESNRHALA